MPTIILLGARSAGKSTVADYLVAEEGFRRVRVASPSENERDVSCLYFATASEFLDYATVHWRERFVSSGIRNRKELDGFVKRPWVLLVGCEAGLGWRWRRRNEHALSQGLSEVSLEHFVQDDDLEMFGSAEASTSNTAMVQTPKKKKSTMQTLHIPHGDSASTLNLPTIPPPSPELSRRASYASANGTEQSQSPLAPLMRMCNLHIQTSAFASIEDLRIHLKELNLTLEDRMRPGWDRYFMTLAGLASLRSNCMKRRVGAVLVSNKRVISTGYNGTPRGMRNCNEGGCARCNSTSVSTISANGNGGTRAVTPIKSGVGLDNCLCLHAEENALLEAGRDRVEGGVIYCNTCPCLLCAVKICQTGVREVCYSQAYSMDEMSAAIFREAGVVFRQINLD